MIRPALVRNPASTENLRGAPAELPDGAHLISVQTLDALGPALSEARDNQIDLLMIDGGDGTIREVLSRLPEIWGSTLPRIALLPRGNTNLIAREVGGLVPGTAGELLDRLAHGQTVSTCRRYLLRADRAGAAPLRGFILGWGAYAEGTRLAREEIQSRGTGQVALAVLSVLRRTLIGASGRALRQGIDAPLAPDGRATRPGNSLMGLATTLQRPLVAGLNPFWGDGDQPIRWLDVPAPAPYLAVAAPFMAFGRPLNWMHQKGYLSGRSHRIEVMLNHPFVMDGEAFDPPEEGPLVLSAEEEVVFLSL